jgi:hypothetical protein
MVTSAIRAETPITRSLRANAVAKLTPAARFSVQCVRYHHGVAWWDGDSGLRPRQRLEQVVVANLDIARHAAIEVPPAPPNITFSPAARLFSRWFSFPLQILRYAPESCSP